MIVSVQSVFLWSTAEELDFEESWQYKVLEAAPAAGDGVRLSKPEKSHSVVPAAARGWLIASAGTQFRVRDDCSLSQLAGSSFPPSFSFHSHAFTLPSLSFKLPLTSPGPSLQPESVKRSVVYLQPRKYISTLTWKFCQSIFFFFLHTLC